MRRFIPTMVAGAVAFLQLGCKPQSRPDPRQGGVSSSLESTELLLYCGAGIRPPVQELSELFEQTHSVRILTDYAGSQVLLSKIKLSGMGDLYLPGDKHYVDLAAEEGLIRSQQNLGYFAPTLLVCKGNPKGIRGLGDLVREGLKLGLGNPEACAIGRISKRLFATNQIPWPAIEKNLSFQSMTVNELGLQIQSGSLDAVIVWEAIAKYYADYGEAISIPASHNIFSTVNIGVLSTTRNEPMANRFVAFALSKEGQAVFAKHGYRIESPP